MKKTFLEKRGVTYQDQVRATIMMLIGILLIGILWIMVENEKQNRQYLPKT